MSNDVTINEVDAPTGAGKTTALINYISDNYNDFKISNKRFIVAVPFKSEVARITNAVRGYVAVSNPVGTKTENILDLIKQGKNIITTHSCFMLACFNIAETIRKGNCKYEFLCDEELPVFSGVYQINDRPIFKKEYTKATDYLQLLSKSDYEIMLRDKIITINKDTDKIVWNYNHADYGKGAYSIIQEVSKNCDIYYIKSQAGQDSLLLLTNSEIWNAFEKITVLTYRFETLDFGIYCRLYNIPVKPYHIENNSFVEGYKEEYPKGLLRLFFKRPKFVFSLSKTWFDSNKGKTDYKLVTKEVAKFCRKAPGKYLWCTFKQYASDFKHKYVSIQDSTEKTRENGIRTYRTPCNVKATNEYTDRTMAVYACGRYMHPSIKRFLEKHKVSYNEEQWALSALIQFVWRSNVRDSNSKEQVTLAILANREYELFKSWFDRGKEVLSM